MKDSKNQIKAGLVIWIVASIVVVIFQMFFLKARQTTNPTIDPSPGDIYTTAWETLTAIKRNTLASKVNSPSLSQQYTSNAVLSTTSTSWTDTDMSITMTTPTGHVLLLMNWSTWNASASQRNGFVFNIDGSDVVSSTCGNTHINQTEAWAWKCVSMSRFASVTAWSHTFKVRRKTSWSTAYMNWSAWTHSRQFQVIVLP